jgi:nucleoporin SEH1
MEDEEGCILTEHQDVIHDIALDWHGTHLATASTDKNVKIHSNVSGTNQWRVEGTIELKGSCLKICWARPEFGRILAVACIDCNFYIIERKKSWVKEHNQAIYSGIEDIKFIPYQQKGLILAIATASGSLKLMLAKSIINLKSW